MDSECTPQIKTSLVKFFASQVLILDLDTEENKSVGQAVKVYSLCWQFSMDERREDL